MKKHIITLFLIFASVVNLHAAITYELNGGVTNDYGWMSKNDMFQSCMADAGVTGLPSLAELKEQQSDPFALIAIPFGIKQCQAILDNAKWDWLEAYILSVHNADAAATVLTEGAASAGWRYALAAFFIEGQWTGWPKSADFSLAGKYEAFQPAWKHGFANPTEPTSDWVLNAPYKEGYTFVGWYTTPDFSGNKVTTINASTTGTLYAKWQENSSIYFVNAQNWTTVNVYAWTTDPNASWPGVAATKEAEQIAGYDVYSYTVEAGTYANVIFNNGSGQQTADLVWTSGKYYVKDGWYTKEEAESKLSPTITYELNGGVTNDYGWMSKDDMFQACMADCGATDLPSLEELKALGNDAALTTIGTKLTDVSGMMALEKWDWFEAYVMEVQNADANATVLTEGTTSASWRYAIAAFFVEGQRTSWPKSADFSRAGTYEAFQPAWKHGFANPTEPTSDWVLNAPYKEGSTFDGWYTTPDFSGNKVTTINTSTTGTLYAKWRGYTPTIAEVKAMAVNTQTKLSGVVTFIEGKNVYIQDITGGILLSMAANPTFTVSQSIIVQGTKGQYGGAPQLQGCVEVSAEAGTMPDPMVFEDLNELINDTKLKYCALLVKISGLTITEYDNYNNPTFFDGIRSAKGDNMVLDPTVFPIGSRVVVTAIADYYNGFRFVGDPAGVEYASPAKKDSYTYPVRNDKYALTNNWIFSNNEDNFAANNPGNNFDVVRGMAAKDGIMYFINRETESLVRVDAATGIMLAPLKITGDHLFQVQGEDGTYTDAVTYKFNDVKFDQAGNCLIGGLITAPQQHFMIYTVNLETGVATLLIDDCLADNPAYANLSCRFDAFGVAGDVTKNGVVMAADASGSWKVYRWLIKDGVAGEGEQVAVLLDPAVDQSLFINAKGFGTAPQILPLDEEGSLFYVDGSNTLPILFYGNPEDGAVLVDDFINVPTGLVVTNIEGEEITMNTGHNGLVEFQVGDDYFLLMAASNTAASTPSTFALYKFADEARTFEGMEPLWYFPAKGMGTLTNGCRTAIPAVEVIDDSTAKLYLYTNNNGYASYTFRIGDLLSPTITYELNGGVTNDYGWMSKGDMFTACITDALGYDLGKSLEEFKRSNTPFSDLLIFFDINHCQNLLDNARWDWLEDYLIMVQEEDQLAVPLTKGVASKDWRYAIAAFFFESQYDTSSDYSQAGLDEAYIPYWKHGYDNPTQPTKEWVLNAPYKENYLFEGWYTTKTFTDEPIITVNASTNGTLYAKWKYEIVSSDTVGICFYDTYYWDINDEIYDRTGTYYATDEEGKHVLHLTVYPLTEDVEIFDTIRAGEIYDFEGRELTQTGTYYEAMLDDNGCDYTITLHLTVVHEEYVNICQGETYTWAVNSQIYSETGTYNLTTNDGIFILHLTVNPLIYTEETITTCDSYQWNGQTYTQSGDYTYTTTATNGCDSTVTLHLTINQTQYAEETITACDNYEWNGQTYTQSGDYTYTTTATNGCDSIAILHLMLHRSKHTEEYITACDSYEWNGQTYTESGTYTHTSTTIDGCDSIVTLYLTINYSQVGKPEYVTICHGETYTWNGQTYSTAGEYSVTLSNTNGCDSTATLHLTIMPQAQEEVQYETINKKETPFIWQKNGKKYYETTTDSIFIPYTHYDCDSMIYILDLTVVDIEDVRAEYDTICESTLPYEWHGQSITTGGRYEYTEKYGDTNIDILHVLYLTVIPTIRTQQSATICYEETFAWNGNTYSQTGTYTYTTEAANGCDSVVTLYLTVLPPAITIYTDTMIAHVDLPYIWRGQYCDTSGEYTATIPFAANTACDSVIYVLNLTVESVNKCGADLSWEYDNGILTISGSGAMYDTPDLQSYRHESWYPYRVRQVILSDQLTHIGNVAFADCANLTSIKIPSSVTSIGDGAFSWTGLLSVTIPASVTELGEQVFETCNNLQTILYEGTPSSISNQTIHPFIGCVHLDTIITPAELWHCTSADPVLENRYGVPHKARYIEVTNGFLTNQAMKYIAKNATTLKVLDLTYATNTTLPYGALSDSYQLSTLYLPQQIEVIPESMIEGGHNLTEILIPATVTEIGNYAFAGCTNVWRMTVEAVLPPKAYDKTFDGIDRSISLIVPAGSEDLYRQAEYWREFFIEPTHSPLPISHCQKLLHEDHILILREGKVYTTMGQLLK